MLLSIDWNFFYQDLWGEHVYNYIWFAGIVLATLLLKRPASKALAHASCSVANRYSDKRHADVFHDLVRKPFELLLQSILYFIAINQLSKLFDSVILLHRAKDKKQVLDVRLGDVIDHIFLLLMILSATLVVSRIIDFAYHVHQDKAQKTDNKGRQQLLPLIKELVKLLLWTLSFFWILGAVFHVNIPALITGLGIGGVAIALAAKESVENLFAAFTILSDKPFQVGDTIKLGNFEGVVERIGFRSTRIRNSDGSIYIIPNQKLVDENVENKTNRDTSGVHLTINIKYGIPHDKLQQMIDELKTMITKTLHVRQPIEISLDAFGENSFQLVVGYHLPHPMDEGATESAIKQEINLNAYAIVTRYTGKEAVSVENSSTPPEKPAQAAEEEPKKKKDDLGGIL